VVAALEDRRSRRSRCLRGLVWAWLGLVGGASPSAAQHPFGQLGGGVASGARQVSQPADHGVFLTGGVALGLAFDAVMVRIEGRAFDTETEPLLTVGAAIAVSVVRTPGAQLYLLGGGGLGAFVEEGDPGDHVGIGAGVATSGPVGFYAELRYDHLIGTFTYSSRHRGLGSAVVGLRFGAL